MSPFAELTRVSATDSLAEKLLLALNQTSFSINTMSFKIAEAEDVGDDSSAPLIFGSIDTPLAIL